MTSGYGLRYGLRLGGGESDHDPWEMSAARTDSEKYPVSEPQLVIL